MTNPPARRLGIRGWLLILAVSGASLSLVSEARGQSSRPARQVTIFGVVATPNSTAIDPKLRSVGPQLRELLPNHGFRLLDARSKRLASNQTISCDLGGGYAAGATLVRPLDGNGKVQLRCEILMNDITQFARIVATPPNQLFFFDKVREDGSHVLIGVGAR